MRSEFNSDYFVKGRLAEERFHDFLHDSNWEHTWYNELEDKKIPGKDFQVFLSNWELAYEKPELFSSMKSDGVDFLSNKVDNLPIKTVYCLEFKVGFVVSPDLEYIKTHGKKVQKVTDRGSPETFYRVPFVKLPGRFYDFDRHLH